MKKLVLIVILILGIVQANAPHQATTRRKNYNIQDGIAIQGFDAVSYFQGKPVKGKKEFAVIDRGITYYFISAENKNEFLQNASKYEPQYGGWCAYAVGEKNEKVEIDPVTFKIINGKLYLFYNKYFNNTLKSWNKDEQNLKMKADKNWGSMNR
jgi:YHS domain-containing protein